MIFVFLVDWLKTVKKQYFYLLRMKIVGKNQKLKLSFYDWHPLKMQSSLAWSAWSGHSHHTIISPHRSDLFLPRKTLLGYFYFSWETNHFLWDVSTMTEITHIFHDLMYQYHWSTMDHPHHSTGSHCTRGKFRGLNVEKILTS